MFFIHSFINTATDLNRDSVQFQTKIGLAKRQLETYPNLHELALAVNPTKLVIVEKKLAEHKLSK